MLMGTIESETESSNFLGNPYVVSGPIGTPAKEQVMIVPQIFGIVPISVLGKIVVCY